MKNTSQRLYYIDWLRVLAMLSIFFFHAVQWQINSLAKYIVIASLSFIAIMGLYEIIIKRFQVARFLFGLKLK